MSTTKKILCLSLVGLALVWSPLYGTSEIQLFPTLGPNYDLTFWARIASLTSFCMACVCFTLLQRHSKKKQPRTSTVMVVASIVYTAGITIGVASGLGVFKAWGLFAGAILRGFAFLPIIACWLSALSHNDNRCGAVAIFLGLGWYALFGIAVFAAAGISPYLAGAALIAAPLISLFGYTASTSNETDVAKTISHSPNTSIPKKALAQLLVANLAFGMVYGSLMFCFNTLTSYLSLICFIATSLLMTLFTYGYFEKHSPGDLLRIVVLIGCVLCVAAVMASTLSPNIGIYLSSIFLVLVIFYSLSIFNDAEMGAAGYDWSIMSGCLLCAGIGIIGCCLAFYIIGAQNIQSNSVLVLGLAGISFISALFSPNPKQEISTWGFSAMSPKESEETKRLRKCSELGDMANLTSRELEVLQLLAAGQGREQIAEMLVISPHTAKTHIRNVYAKLDVHNARELAQLFK